MKNNSAFPCHLVTDDPSVSTGLTKREYFAAVALQGMLAGRDRDTAYLPNATQLYFYAKQAVVAADLLISELFKKENPNDPAS